MSFSSVQAEVDIVHAGRMLLASIRGLVWKSLFGIFGNVSVGRRLRCYAWPRVTHSKGRIVLGTGVAMGNVTLQVMPEAKLTVGDNVSINDWTVLASMHSIEIGDGCLIGELVSIRDYDHQFGRTDIDIKHQGFAGAPIRIGRNAWIGRGAAILKGVSIGDGAVISANAVVTRDIPTQAIAVGVPARVIRYRYGM